MDRQHTKKGACRFLGGSADITLIGLALFIALTALFATPALSTTSVCRLCSRGQAALQAEPYDVTVAISSMDPNPVMAGQPVMIAASVAASESGVGIPTGLLEIKAGQNLSCQFTLDASGEGSCSLVFPAGGIVPLKAVYPGESPFLPGVSDVSYLTVESQEMNEVVYQHDFETPVGSEWCLKRLDVTPSGRGFLGQFGNETACLELVGLPPHTLVSVSFDLYIIRSWNGNQVSSETAAPSDMPEEPEIIVGPDRWQIKADGQSLLFTTFSNWLGHPQAYPGPYPGVDYPRFTGAAEKFTLGYTSATGLMDSVYRQTYTFTHNQSTLNLDFLAMGLQSILNESWGLDNIVVRCITPGTTGSIPVTLNRGAMAKRPHAFPPTRWFSAVNRRVGIR